jgi:hypothetical protein
MASKDSKPTGVDYYSSIVVGVDDIIMHITTIHL